MPPALKTDQHPITFSDRNDFDAAQLIHLYRQAPWAKHRALEQAQARLAKTDVVISAWDGPRLVGFGRVLTDYVFRASIWDVIVDRDYQGRKIGTEIFVTVATLVAMFGGETVAGAVLMVIILIAVGAIMLIGEILPPE